MRPVPPGDARSENQRMRMVPAVNWAQALIVLWLIAALILALMKT
jgi:hypothetical protein